MDDDNQPQSHILYQKTFGKAPVQNGPSPHLKEYLENQNISLDGLLTTGDSMGDLDTELEKMTEQGKNETEEILSEDTKEKEPNVVQPPLTSNEEKKEEVLSPGPVPSTQAPVPSVEVPSPSPLQEATPVSTPTPRVTPPSVSPQSVPQVEQAIPTAAGTPLPNIPSVQPQNVVQVPPVPNQVPINSSTPIGGAH